MHPTQTALDKQAARTQMISKNRFMVIRFTQYSKIIRSSSLLI